MNVANVVIETKEIIAEYTDIENIYFFIKTTADIKYLSDAICISILNNF